MMDHVDPNMVLRGGVCNLDGVFVREGEDAIDVSFI